MASLRTEILYDSLVSQLEIKEATYNQQRNFPMNTQMQCNSVVTEAEIKAIRKQIARIKKNNVGDFN